MSKGLVRARVELDLSPAEGLRAGGIRRATRIGLSRASSPVKAAVVNHAQAVKRFGFLAASIRIRLRSYPADRWVSVIGPAGKYTRTRGKYTRGPHAGQPRKSVPGKYAHLVEKGTARSRARPWLRPAYDETAGRFRQDAGAEVGKEIELELQRRAAATAARAR